MARNKILAGIALAIALTSTAVPVQAGQISINLAPRDAEQHRMLQAGLGLYALVNEIESGSIRQNGIGNIAGIMQGGGNNLGIVHQEGNGHNGTLDQQGGGNSYGLFQFGEGTSAHVRQSGGQSGLGFVFGW
ncbi:curlin [Pelagibacterium sp. 26DY04]|uniref:curlin n=1 Tax=Pelagibacterium sp. 26DY04 TaxID=2967130 RepID=UPI002814F541|nr:curlin [Pelagibacterium sp. 26DY04]WMT88003.1 curlin [Pelagibacterium sp. 26DY04]